MEGLQAFETAARNGGFIMMNESTNRGVLWLKKVALGTTTQAHQLMCIDSLTNSVTIFWINVLGEVNSKTFRGVPALQEWFDSTPQTILQR
jgi:hypothetical protein